MKGELIFNHITHYTDTQSIDQSIIENENILHLKVVFEYLSSNCFFNHYYLNSFCLWPFWIKKLKTKQKLEKEREKERMH